MVASVGHANSHTIRVAVIDTGFDFKSTWSPIIDLHPFLRKPKLCDTGHADFSGTDTIEDQHGHGTHIAGIIAQYANNTDYCLVILKFFNPSEDSNNLKNEILAINEAVRLKVDIINLSGGGTEYSKEECWAVKSALDKGITFVSAAGNERSDINLHPYYPAMCDMDVKAVANITLRNTYSPSSNYTNDKINSRFLFKEKGENVLSILPGNTIGYMTGTSQSTAIRTGKIVKNWIEHKNNMVLYRKLNSIKRRKYNERFKSQGIGRNYQKRNGNRQF